MVEIAVGQLSRPKQGENCCGDSILVHRSGPIMRLAIIDGLGHGQEAQQAANLARDALHNCHCSLEELLKFCHHELLGTRGAVLGITDFDFEQKIWRGITLGNISVGFYGKDHFTPLNNRGIAGYSLPAGLSTWSRPYIQGQILIMHSDGIDQLVGLEQLLSPAGGLGQAPAQDLAESIMVKYGKLEDDLAILVAK